MSGVRSYILVETGVSVAINAALSAGFTWLLFHGRAPIAPFGERGFAADFPVQTFMVALMSVLVPSLIARARLRAGRLTAAPPLWVGRWPLWARALGLAVPAAIGLGGLAMAAASLAGPLSLPALLAFKTLYGAVLAAVVTPWALRATLAEPVKSVSPSPPTHP
ncbi:hypothetical protein [Caulobacter sp. UNC279MFTsu5.1]|uniref:hypothetical protein n=1 Tax=Caulobacter sp. UNC279MFTsu5.1 TaxID=1502775 RepID=UPI00039E2B8A|nr:hypothetical protein [Caulobacter sp. UNC279MFTsu5.1]SFK40055.1 hypothetical protein SAMN02799626_04194 [Caulobacter sp. UNC279MFTsu5.1]